MIDADPPHLAAAFLAAAGAVEAPTNLGERLHALLLAGQAAHPRVRLGHERFARHLARHAPREGPLDVWLAALCAADLYLACACAEGNRAAIEALDRRYRSQVSVYLAKLRATPAFVEDVAQAVRERLFVSEGGAAPKIAEYAGRGPLGSWLRVITVRLAIDMKRQREEQAVRGNIEEVAAARAGGRGGEEGELIKQRYAGAFNAAFRAALGALPAEERRLLREHFAEGATLEQLAAVRGVHRATVARWIAGAREEILRGAMRRLREELGVRGEELESLMGLMRSRIELGLSSSFGEE